MSLKTAKEPPAPTAKEVWDLARRCSTTVWHVSPSETVNWPVDGCKNPEPRSYCLWGSYYETPEGIGIKRRHWFGRRYLSVVGCQAFEITVDPSILTQLNAELERRKRDDFLIYSRDMLRKTKKEDEAIQLLEA